MTEVYSNGQKIMSNVQKNNEYICKKTFRMFYSYKRQMRKKIKATYGFFC